MPRIQRARLLVSIRVIRAIRCFYVLIRSGLASSRHNYLEMIFSCSELAVQMNATRPVRLRSGQALRPEPRSTHTKVRSHKGKIVSRASRLRPPVSCLCSPSWADSIGARCQGSERKMCLTPSRLLGSSRIGDRVPLVPLSHARCLLRHSANGAIFLIKALYSVSLGITTGRGLLRSMVIVPAQQLRVGYPSAVRAFKCLGLTAGNFLAQCSESCVHRIRAPGEVFRTASTISCRGVSYLPRPIEKITHSGLTSSHRLLANVFMPRGLEPPP
jgi:hypothetical protein